MKIPHIISKVYGEPWAILPDTHRAIQLAVEAKLKGQSQEITIQQESDDEEFDCQPRQGVLIIPVHGIIGKHLNPLETMCGGCDLDMICDQIYTASEDDSIEVVGFDFRSPGGVVTGVSEAASEIKALSEVGKTTFAFTDSMCCSAAYWMASQCGSIFTTKSAMLGSVGVRSYYEDWSRWMANVGIKPEPFTSGKFKDTGASYKPMTDEERSMLQSRVDKLGAEFREAVSAERDIKPECMEAQVFFGTESAANGYADAVVKCIEEAIDLVR